MDKQWNSNFPWNVHNVLTGVSLGRGRANVFQLILSIDVDEPSVSSMCPYSIEVLKSYPHENLRRHYCGNQREEFFCKISVCCVVYLNQRQRCQSPLHLRMWNTNTLTVKISNNNKITQHGVSFFMLSFPLRRKLQTSHLQRLCWYFCLSNWTQRKECFHFAISGDFPKTIFQLQTSVR